MSEDLVAIARLSPAPTASDYDAICAALMQTERGRWFLQEYALRNRSADTKLLLSAIERIEAVVCAERSRQVQQSFRSDLMEMASAITRTRAEVAELKAAAGGPAVAANSGSQPPGDVFAAAERIRDVTWAMRGHGFDPSTCQQLEDLAETILSASALRDPTDHRAGKLSEVLQYLERRIATLVDSCAEVEAPTERGGKPQPEAAEPLPAVAAAEGREDRPNVMVMPTVDDSEDAAESGQIRSFLAALHDDLDDTADPPSPSVANGPMTAAVAAAGDAQAVDAASLLASPPEVRDQAAAQPSLEAFVDAAAACPAAAVVETIGAPIETPADRLPEILPDLAGVAAVDGGSTPPIPTLPADNLPAEIAPPDLTAPGDATDSLPARLLAIVSSAPAAAAPMRPAPAQPAPSDPDPPDGDQAGLSSQLAGNDPLAALKAMSEDELIALFS